MGIVEMLKQPDCLRCEDAKSMLTKLGYQGRRNSGRRFNQPPRPRRPDGGGFRQQRASAANAVARRAVGNGGGRTV